MRRSPGAEPAAWALLDKRLSLRKSNFKSGHSFPIIVKAPCPRGADISMNTLGIALAEAASYAKCSRQVPPLCVHSFAISSAS